MSAWAPFADAHGRVARSLRLSVTDRCDLRCVYCMAEAPEWLSKEDILSYEELARLAAVAVRCGLRKIHVTGGEPLARRGLPGFIRTLRALPGVSEVVLTTNGAALSEHAEELKRAGLDRVTVSLDTLDPARFARIARRGGLERVLAGIAAAEKAGFAPIKVNAVVIRGVNDDETAELAAWAREGGRGLRFIEFMPLEGDRFWSRERLVPAAEIAARVAERFPLVPRPPVPGETARLYDYADGRGSLGIIASVTEAFCASCDRARITADGGFRNCLFASSALDLRGPLRAGASDEDLAALMRGEAAAKGPGHLIGLPAFARPDRAMNAIGG